MCLNYVRDFPWIILRGFSLTKQIFFSSSQKAFAVLGFPDNDKESLYKSTASVLHMGEMKFKQRPREEQAEADGTAGKFTSALST